MIISSTFSGPAAVEIFLLIWFPVTPPGIGAHHISYGSGQDDKFSGPGTRRRPIENDLSVLPS